MLGLSDKKLFLNVFLEVGDDARDHLAYIDLQDNSFHILMEINLYPLTKFIGNSKYIFLEDSRNLQMVNLVDQTLKQIATNVGKLVVHEGDFMVAEGNTASYIVYANAAVTDRVPGFRRGRAPTNFLRTMGMNAPQDLFAIDMSSGKIKEIPFFLEPQLRCIFHVFGTTLYCCNMDIDEDEPGERIGYKFDLTEDSPQPVKFEL